MSVEKIGQGADAEGHDYHTRRLSRRTAAVAAAFFLPHLRPGMRVLDGGCGPGTITVRRVERIATAWHRGLGAFSLHVPNLVIAPGPHVCSIGVTRPTLRALP